ncbi:uncharacterized protein I303_105335 [Kwoniella dejecticola CBS 10117]|uniref:RNase III domain-containing protein n=1 Tax=Kwoniella dejecticola CBS 10117 TaxID=1296121 RepID=A0AAJ8MIP6_9TREE
MRYQVLENGNNPLFAFVLPPLPRLKLPRLPNIQDKGLFKQVTTHVSVQQLNRRGVMALAKPDEDLVQAVDYEKLEHVGDGLLESIASGLIQDLYPWLRHGGAAIMRDHLVSNATLAQLSIFYNLPLLINAREESLEYVRSSEKIQASVLEAWIAGVFYDFLQSGEGGYLIIDEEGDIEYQQRDRVLFSENTLNMPEDKPEKREEEGEREAAEEEPEIVGDYQEEIVIVDDSEIEPAPKGLQPALEPNRLVPDSQSKIEAPLPAVQCRAEVAIGGPPISHTADLEDMIGMMMTTALLTTTNKVTRPTPEQAIFPGGYFLAGGEGEKSAIPNSRLGEDQKNMQSAESHQLDEVTKIAREPQIEAEGEAETRKQLQCGATQGPATAKRSKGQAYDYLISWLHPLLTPYCQWIYTRLLEEQTKILRDLPPENPKLTVPDHWKEEDRKSVGMPQALMQHPWIRISGCRPTFVKMPMPGQRWKVVCTVTDLDGKEWTGEGVRGTAQSAKNVAAWMVYRQLGQ